MAKKNDCFPSFEYRSIAIRTRDVSTWEIEAYIQEISGIEKLTCSFQPWQTVCPMERAKAACQNAKTNLLGHKLADPSRAMTR